MAVLEGARNVEILKQNEGSPMPVEEQVAIIYCGSTEFFRKFLLQN